LPAIGLPGVIAALSGVAPSAPAAAAPLMIWRRLIFMAATSLRAFKTKAYMKCMRGQSMPRRLRRRAVLRRAIPEIA